MTDPHYTPLGDATPAVVCATCAATVALTAWWMHVRWHRELVDVQRVVAAEAALDAREAHTKAITERAWAEYYARRTREAAP